MPSPETAPQSPKEREYSGWIALFAGIAGVVVGLFFGHWAACGLAFGCVGWVIGGLVDRSRR